MTDGGALETLLASGIVTRDKGGHLKPGDQSGVLDAPTIESLASLVAASIPKSTTQKAPPWFAGTFRRMVEMHASLQRFSSTSGSWMSSMESVAVLASSPARWWRCWTCCRQPTSGSSRS